MTTLLDPDSAASTTNPVPDANESVSEVMSADEQVAKAGAVVAEPGDVEGDVADDSTESSATPGEDHEGHGDASAQTKVVAGDEQPVDDGRPLGKIITVFAPKGGAGKTTVSTNLAVVLNASGANRVCLVDIDLEFGDIAIALRLAPTNTLLDYVQATTATADARRAGALTSFQPGLDCVLAPVSPADSEYISAAHVGALLRDLRRHYDFVVVDTPPNLAEHVLEALDIADVHVLLTTPEVTALKNLRLALDMFDLLGYPRQARAILFNKSDKQAGISAAEAADILCMPVGAEVPMSSDIPASVNRGVPVSLANPKHPVAVAIRTLAETSITHGPITAQRRNGRRGLKLRMRSK